MKHCLRSYLLFGALVVFFGCAKTRKPSDPKKPIRIATFNLQVASTQKLTDIDANGRGRHTQMRAIAGIIQRVRPDILVLNEIDHEDPSTEEGRKRNAVRLVRHYLNQGEQAIDYPYVFAAPCNTGILSGFDFDNNGVAATESNEGERFFGNDCYGFGFYPGQYAMAVLSRFPIDTKKARTFQKFLWKDFAYNEIPPDFYIEEELAVLRLSSKSHWDVPIQIHNKTLHVLVSHPTPQGFDGTEDRNGRRNFDEIGFWRAYIDNSPTLYDDQGQTGGLAPDAFVCDRRRSQR